MAGVLAAVATAATSIGFPIRNMHTISETGNTSDVLAATHAIARSLQALDDMDDGKGKLRRHFQNNHPRLDQAERLGHQGSEGPDDQDED
jgi:endoglucanase